MEEPSLQSEDRRGRRGAEGGTKKELQAHGIKQ